jgi:hypothetical protein
MFLVLYKILDPSFFNVSNVNESPCVALKAQNDRPHANIDEFSGRDVLIAIK